MTRGPRQEVEVDEVSRTLISGLEATLAKAEGRPPSVGFTVLWAPRQGRGPPTKGSHSAGSSGRAGRGSSGFLESPRVRRPTLKVWTVYSRLGPDPEERGRSLLQVFL